MRLFKLLAFMSTGFFLPKNDSLPTKGANKPYFTDQKNEWVDSLMLNLTTEQKVAQLFMVAVYSNQTEATYRSVENLIANKQVGGLIFMQGDAPTQARLTNRYQAVSKIPLLVGIDGEWGLAMRLPNVINYPKAMTIGAITDSTLVENMALDMAKQFKRIGVNLNFGPVADVNSNPTNPVIGLRSFGENPLQVGKMATAFARGLQKGRVMACAKHFPGHGDTSGDSHHSLPIVKHNLAELMASDLPPFQRLIADSVMCILSAHLMVPALEKRNIASSQSNKILEELLRNQLNFKGLVISDALNMQGASKGSPGSGEIELQSFLAGNDILLMPENLLAGINRITNAIKNKQITEDQLNQKVKRILQAKAWAGFENGYKPVNEKNVSEDLNSVKYLAHKQKLCQGTITLVANQDNLIPLEEGTIAKNLVSVAIGADFGNKFQATLAKFGQVSLHTTDSRSDEKWFNTILAKADSTKTFVVSLHRLVNSASRRYNITPVSLNFINRLQKKAKVVVVSFGSPYALKYLDQTKNLVNAYEEDPQMQEAAAQSLMGIFGMNGVLSTSANTKWPAGFGLKTKAKERLGYSYPEAEGINSSILLEFDKQIADAINQKIFPGCNVLIAKNSKIVYQKSFGTYRYETEQKVSANTLYDLASVSKVAATVQSIMKLVDQGKVKLTDKASQYLPEMDSTNKKNMTVLALLKHEAGLLAYVPFWEMSLAGGKPNKDFYNSQKSDLFPFTVGKDMFGNQALKDSTWAWLLKSPLNSRAKGNNEYGFLYSDLGLIILQKIIEKQSGFALDQFCKTHFFEPLYLNRTGFNPLFFLALDQIAPTENDKYFRKQQLQGTVQDQQAAILGGVSGHAGLFSTTSDLAKLLQMNLNGGHYAGTRFLSDSTLKLFTQGGLGRGHRGLGWDKLPDDGDSHYISSKVSEVSYGHSGYTGTMVWVDPKYNLLYIFLTNRVYPSVGNNKLNALKIRRKLHDIVYKALL